MTAPSGPHKVLIIEDNAMNALLFRTILEANGFMVTEAATGVMGYELACRELPAVILSDIALPDIDGTEVLKKLRGDVRTKHIPVIALTAFATNSDRQLFLGLGFSDYISKPIDVRTFPQIVLANIS